MEQKTEASQAVYFPPLPEPDHSLDNGAQPYFTAIQMFAYVRAALKAQPAHTEAPKIVCTYPSSRHLPPCDECVAAGGCIQASHKGMPTAPAEAQGEDSARLEFGEITSVVHADRGTRHILTVYFKTKEGRDDFQDVFGGMVLKDRARASAETGGVKS